MSKQAILALLSFLVVVAIAFTFAPARAAQPDSVVYTWEYASLGSDQLVCKQIAVYPKEAVQRGRQPVRIAAKIVNNKHCAKLTKPRP